MRSILLTQLVDFAVANRFFNVTVSERKFSKFHDGFSSGSFSAMRLKYERNVNLMLIQAGRLAYGNRFHH